MIKLQSTDLKDKRVHEEEERLKEIARETSIQNLGAELAAEKIKGMTKDAAIKNFGAEIANLKLDIMQMKGGVN